MTLDKLDDLRIAFDNAWALSEADRETMLDTKAAFYDHAYVLMPYLLASVDILSKLAEAHPYHQIAQAVTEKFK